MITKHPTASGYLFTLTLLTLIFTVMLSGCVTGGSKDKDKDSKGKDNGSPDSKIDKGDDDDFYVSGNLETMTLSLNNSPLTSKKVDKREVSDLAAKLRDNVKSSKGTDRKSMVALLSLQRIGGEGIVKVMEAAREMVAFEMRKSVNRGIPEFAKLELVLAAIQSKKYSYAEHFIYDLIESKNKKIKAAAYTAEGIIAAQDDRLPEAVASWGKALDAVPDYTAAQLNIGFVALRYGDFGLAKKMLGNMQGDWFGAYGLATADRMSKENDHATTLCKRVNDTKPRFKPGLYNCALHAYQGLNDAEQAHSLLDRATKIPGLNQIDERAFALREQLQKTSARAAKKPAPAAKPGDKKPAEQPEKKANGT